MYEYMPMVDMEVLRERILKINTEAIHLEHYIVTVSREVLRRIGVGGTLKAELYKGIFLVSFKKSMVH